MLKNPGHLFFTPFKLTNLHNYNAMVSAESGFMALPLSIHFILIEGKFNLPVELKLCKYKCNIKCMEKCSLDNQFVLKSISVTNIFIFKFQK